MDASFRLNVTMAEWERIAAAGAGVLFREGVEQAFPSDRIKYGAWGPPAEFVEAAQPCETCDDGSGMFGGMPWLDCPDCLNGKRRVAVVVPCEHLTVRTVGNELECIRCLGDGLVTVGHVVVTWGPDPVVQYGEHATVGSYVVVLVEPGSRKAFRVENHRLPVEQHELTLPPDVDPQTLVGQYAISVEAVG